LTSSNFKTLFSSHCHFISPGPGLRIFQQGRREAWTARWKNQQHRFRFYFTSLVKRSVKTSTTCAINPLGHHNSILNWPYRSMNFRTTQQRSSALEGLISAFIFSLSSKLACPTFYLLNAFRVVNNSELKGAPNLAKKRTKRCTIFFSQKEPYFW